MSTLIRFPVTHENILGYRFGKAELQTASERLLVDGEEVALSPMAYRFLLGLCRARGALLTRADAFDLLWPGGGSGSDEALAQIVLKVRQALASEGRAIATVRGRGFRLELPVEPVAARPLAVVGDSALDSQPVDAAVDPVATPVAEPMSTVVADAPLAPGPAAAAHDRRAGDRAPVVRHRVALLGVAVLVLLAGAALLTRQFFVGADLPLEGYAIGAQALGPISTQGMDTVRTALQREDEGDRTSARQLMQGLLESEPSSAVPPFFLTFWLSGSGEDVVHWRTLLRERLPRDAPAYLQTLVRWVAVVGDAPGIENELLSAALKLQPGAWRLRLARAHVSLRLLRFEQALDDLRLLPLATVPPRYAMFVMSDRAGLGDAAAMRTALPLLAPRAPVLAEYVHGRVALAQAQWHEAQVTFEETAQHAEQETLIGALSGSWLYAATAAGAQQDWPQMQHDAEQARRLGTEHTLRQLVSDAEVLIGYSQFRRGLDGQAEASWERAGHAMDDLQDHSTAIRLWLQRARLQPAWAQSHPPTVHADSESPTGLDTLVTARLAWLRCADAEAQRAVIAGESAGLDTSYFADELDLLRQDLGLPRHAVLTAPQLPYPALPRWMTFWEASRSGGIRGCAASAGAAPAASR